VWGSPLFFINERMSVTLTALDLIEWRAGHSERTADSQFVAHFRQIEFTDANG